MGSTPRLRLREPTARITSTLTISSGAATPSSECMIDASQGWSGPTTSNFANGARAKPSREMLAAPRKKADHTRSTGPGRSSVAITSHRNNSAGATAAVPITVGRDSSSSITLNADRPDFRCYPPPRSSSHERRAPRSPDGETHRYASLPEVGDQFLDHQVAREIGDGADDHQAKRQPHPQGRGFPLLLLFHGFPQARRRIQSQPGHWNKGTRGRNRNCDGICRTRRLGGERLRLGRCGSATLEHHMNRLYCIAAALTAAGLVALPASGVFAQGTSAPAAAAGAAAAPAAGTTAPATTAVPPPPPPPPPAPPPPAAAAAPAATTPPPAASTPPPPPAAATTTTTTTPADKPAATTTDKSGEDKSGKKKTASSKKGSKSELDR